MLPPAPPPPMSCAATVLDKLHVWLDCVNTSHLQSVLVPHASWLASCRHAIVFWTRSMVLASPPPPTAGGDGGGAADASHTIPYFVPGPVAPLHLP